ncbi:hypothetical protein GCM10027569_82370 [Flindersiella endophytica]
MRSSMVSRAARRFSLALGAVVLVALMLSGAPTAGAAPVSSETSARNVVPVAPPKSSASAGSRVKQRPDEVDDVWYHLSPDHSDQCLAVPGGSRTQGVGLIQWGCGSWSDH